MTNATFTTGQRVTVVHDRYGRWIGESGTVVDTPTEIVNAPSMRGIDFSDTTWVRMDGQDDRTPAIGFDADDELAPEQA